MKLIGLLGGMSWESTSAYYRLINQATRDQLGGLHSAQILLRSVDFAQIVALQKANDWYGASKILCDEALAMEKAGAQVILICTNTMHLIAPAVENALSIPLINIIDETAEAIIDQGLRRPLLLATRYTMEHGFYAKQMQNHGLEIVVPGPEARSIIHDLIFEELCQGVIKPCARDHLVDCIKAHQIDGADCVILGCTELGLVLNVNEINEDIDLPIFDSTHIHAKSAVAFALSAFKSNQMQTLATTQA